MLAAGGATAVAPVYLVMHHLFQPNFLDVFFWTLNGYLSVRFRHRPSPTGLAMIGAAIGLGLLAKYSTAFCALSVVTFVMISRELRPWLLSRWGVAAALALVIVLPNVGWQAAHDWPVLAHMAALRRNQPGHVAPTDFLLDQLGRILPGVPLWLVGLAFTLTPAGRPYRVLSVPFGLVIGLLLLSHGKNYYAAGLYPPLLALGAVAWERWLPSARWWAWAGRASLLLLLPLLTWRVFPALVPVLPMPELATYVGRLVHDNPQFAGLVRWEDGELHSLPQDVADMRGWPEYAPLAARAWARLTPAERATPCWWAPTTARRAPATGTARRWGCRRAIRPTARYSLWWPEPLAAPSAIIYLTEADEVPDAAAWFTSTESMGHIRDPFARCRGGRVWLLRGPKPGVGPWVRGRVAEARAGVEG